MSVDRLRRPLVLVTDDEEVIRELLKRRLSIDGYDVETAEDGEEALKVVGREFVNVVLTDIKMPGLDGVEVLKRTKAQSPDTEVIMMTAYAAIDTAIEAVRLGAYDYLQKPFEHIDDVSRKVKQALKQQRLELQNREMLKKLDEMNRGLKQVVISRTKELSETQDALRRNQGAGDAAGRLRDGLANLEQRLASGDGDRGELQRLVGELRRAADALDPSSPS